MISKVLERVNAPGTIYGRLRSSAPHVRSVRKDGIIRQRHLPDEFLRRKVNQLLPLSIPSVQYVKYVLQSNKILFMYAGFSTRRPQTLI